MMYDREVDVPRLIGHFRLDPAPDFTPAAILDAARLVVDRTGTPFNTVGLNLYRDGLPAGLSPCADQPDGSRRSPQAVSTFRDD